MAASIRCFTGKWLGPKKSISLLATSLSLNVLLSDRALAIFVKQQVSLFSEVVSQLGRDLRRGSPPSNTPSNSHYSLRLSNSRCTNRMHIPSPLACSGWGLARDIHNFSLRVLGWHTRSKWGSLRLALIKVSIKRFLKRNLADVGMVTWPHYSTTLTFPT